MMTTAQEFERRRWIALVLLCFAQFIVVLDASIVNVALPSIGEGLDFSQENLAWVVNAYVLTFGGFLLLGGRMADLLGRRRVFISGLLLVAAASLAAGFAATEGQLIAARAAQGLGAAIISPAALSIVTTIFRDGAERNKALGAWGAVAGAGGAAGVLFGGILTDGLGWEWVLWVNVPVALVVAALAPRLIAESRSESATRHFDAAGAVSVTAGLSILVYAIVDATDAGWGSLQTLGLIGVSAALLATFIAIERRSQAPLMPFRIFRLRTLTGANVVGLLVGGSLFSMFFFITLYMQQVLGYSAIEAGLAYLPLAVSIIIASGIASLLVTRIGFKPVLATGMAADRRRAGLVLAGLGWRRLRLRHPRAVGAGRLWPRVRLRDDDDRRGLWSARAGIRPRERADQHLATDRRRVGARRAGDDRQLADRRRHGVGGRRSRRAHERAHRGLPVGVPRRGGDRRARIGADAGADPRSRQPRTRRARALPGG